MSRVVIIHRDDLVGTKATSWVTAALDCLGPTQGQGEVGVPRGGPTKTGSPR